MLKRLMISKKLYVGGTLNGTFIRLPKNRTVQVRHNLREIKLMVEALAEQVRSLHRVNRTLEMWN